jgi:hypothetical protein
MKIGSTVKVTETHGAVYRVEVTAIDGEGFNGHYCYLGSMEYKTFRDSVLPSRKNIYGFFPWESVQTLIVESQ